MVVSTCDPSNKLRQELLKFTASLGYTVSIRLSEPTKTDPVSRTKTKDILKHVPVML